MEPKSKVNLIAFASTVALTVLMSLGASAQEQWALGTSSAGSGLYRWGATIANVINTAKAAEGSFAATASFNENLLLVADGTLPLAFSEASATATAYRGLPPFNRATSGLKNLRWVAMR